MLEITNLTHGEILNRHYGVETENKLTVELQGITRIEDKVTVNGVSAMRRGELFSAPVELTERFNNIVVRAEGDRGAAQKEITLLWDKRSFKRANFFIDDNIFFLTEIAKERPKSLFDHFYLKMLKNLHDRYGFKVTLNLFFHNDYKEFCLSQFPADYKGEFQANSDWLRLAFHGYSEFPDRPYQNALPEKVAADYDQIGEEVRRFAGEGVFTPPVVIHWAMAQPDAMQELLKRGVKVISAGYIGTQTFIGETVSDIPVCDIGFFQSEENARFLEQVGLRYDFRFKQIFTRSGICCNLMDIPELKAQLNKLFSDPKRDVIYGMTHEQYSYPFYQNYLPNHNERIETVIRMIAESGYKFVFFNEGFLGNSVK